MIEVAYKDAYRLARGVIIMRLNTENLIRFQKIVTPYLPANANKVLIDAEIIYPAIFLKVTFGLENEKVLIPAHDERYFELLEKLKKEILPHCEENERDVFLIATKHPEDGLWDVEQVNAIPEDVFGEFAQLHRLEEKAVRIARKYTQGHGVLYREIAEPNPYLRGHHCLYNTKGELEYRDDVVYNTPTEWKEKSFAQILIQFHDKWVGLYNENWSTINIIFHAPNHYTLQFGNEDLTATSYEERRDVWKEHYLTVTP